MKDELLTLVRGALLHDIGKVVQRAQDDPTAKRHTEWGYDWLKENFKDELVATAAIAHHYTKDDDYALNNNFGLIWYQADNLASAERKGKEKLEEGKWHTGVALASPFSKIRNPNNFDEKPSLTYLLLLHEGIPEALKKEPVITKDNYKRLLNNFERDFNDLNVKQLHSINLLLMLFEKHFSNVPSITMKIYDGLKKEEISDKHPDISLYDHSKLTAAIAGCMYHYYSETYQEKWNNNELLKDEVLNVSQDTCPYLLVGGDISGVQRFIYTITSKGALKSLKGRSFYLELLAEHVVSALLNELHLTRCNLIFLGGGHFYILSHNTLTAKEAIKRIKEIINDFLFREFKGSLKLHLEYVEFHPDTFRNASPVWHKLSESLEMSKKRKFWNRLEDMLRTEMPHENCLIKSCEVCFREDLPLKELQRGDELISVCEPCFFQYQLGEMLTGISKMKYPVLYKLYTEPEGKFIKIENTFYQLKTGWDPSIHPNADAVYRINDFTAKHYSHPKSIFLPLGIYQQEKLEELEDASGIFGIKRIAVIRMDVDNLGKIFSMAVPENDRTFSRMASISKGLNNFFKYHLNNIVEGKGVAVDIGERDVNKNGRMLSVVYSGGDDLFIIGHWLDVTETAFDLYNYFKKYTGNTFITISGGIAINHNKYPVYQYARDAKEAEDMAKKGSKDAIALFGNRVFRWDNAVRVLDRVKLFKQFLIPKDDHLAIDEEKLPKTFFYRLLALARQFKDDGTLILPKAAYLISRAKTDKCKPEDILELKGVIMNNNHEEWKITEAAAMWTLMLMRKGGEENA
ncbi:MAG: type III-A CRISPR-associated protein Cas10/Csm1 [Nitrospirae bacterium]|nr:type III-A CRISPR-associated protein Cas10/Csm1 [Nitrospirota bacterium]